MKNIFLLFAYLTIFILVASVNQISATEEVRNVNDLINKYGKDSIANFILDKRSMHTAEDPHGDFVFYLGRANPGLITEKSIRHDLNLIGISVEVADKQISKFVVAREKQRLRKEEEQKAKAEAEKRRQAEEIAKQKRIAEERKLAEEKRIAQAKAEEKTKKGLEQDCLNYKGCIDLSDGIDLFVIHMFLNGDEKEKTKFFEEGYTSLLQVLSNRLEAVSTELQTEAIRDLVVNHMDENAHTIRLIESFISDLDKANNEEAIIVLSSAYLKKMGQKGEIKDLRRKNFNTICGNYID